MSARAAMTISLFKMVYLRKSVLAGGVMRRIIDRRRGSLWVYLKRTDRSDSSKSSYGGLVRANL